MSLAIHRNGYYTVDDELPNESTYAFSIHHRSIKYSVQTKPVDRNCERTLFQFDTVYLSEDEDAMYVPKRSLFGRIFNKNIREEIKKAKSQLQDIEGSSRIFVQSGDNKISYDFRLGQVASSLRVSNKELRKHLLYAKQKKNTSIENKDIYWVVDPKYVTKLLEKNLKQAEKIQKVIDDMKAVLAGNSPIKNAERKRKTLLKSLNCRSLKNNEDAQKLRKVFEDTDFKNGFVMATKGRNENRNRADQFTQDLDKFEKETAWWQKKTQT